MPNRRSIWLLIAAGHVAMLICGATRLLQDQDTGAAAQLVRWYGTMSGADSNYGFFAPAVGSKHRARFLLANAEGDTWEEALDQTGSGETRLRLSGIVEEPFMSGQAEDHPEWRRRLVTSLAATMFSRHPNAVSLKMEVEAYDIPPIASYRAGERPKWVKLYQAEFQRQPPPTAQPGTDR